MGASASVRSAAGYVASATVTRWIPSRSLSRTSVSARSRRRALPDAIDAEMPSPTPRISWSAWIGARYATSAGSPKRSRARRARIGPSPVRRFRATQSARFPGGIGGPPEEAGRHDRRRENRRQAGPGPTLLSDHGERKGDHASKLAEASAIRRQALQAPGSAVLAREASVGEGFAPVA